MLKQIPAPHVSVPGDGVAAKLSYDAVYARLKALAHRELSGGARGTLDTTALVHEVYLRMQGSAPLTFECTAQFFAYAARAMRNLLINRARDRMRQKAGGDWQRTTLGSAGGVGFAIASAEQAIAIDEALRRLELDDERSARVFELRYFAGLDAEQVAQITRVTRRTSDRDWRYACAFLAGELG